MTDPTIPVTEDELHAYVDNELPVERRSDVERWLAANPAEAERVESWRSMAEALHARYDSVTNEPVPPRLELDRLDRRPRRWIIGAAAASLVAFAAGGTIGWLAHGAALSPSPLQILTGEALDAHRLYVVDVRHPVEVPGEEKTHLQQWLTRRCGRTVQAPELETTGLKLVGGRLLPGPTGPASFLMYESPSGERFTVYATKAGIEAAQMRYTTQGSTAALSWTERGVSYVVSGGSDQTRLTQVARLVYDQSERTGG
ncbi:anti-sigma factor [Bradyrhizobium sp. SSBR45G]|uniref:anti-sigma factor family protein n=1 Tax=unclassified Bradyrhizobium TaxID=2631580 RepID=UPI002342A87B|nr:MULTISPECIES: anti-sigma factor [unclassified Bradyrhizobium]GLH81400.1 anti-sigma factor [Bradyrhizobium sp. SSBR45G]GLH85920.1 anti-sigma factor [Bradyrhizobium sp. SSBR45R]